MQNAGRNRILSVILILAVAFGTVGAVRLTARAAENAVKQVSTAEEFVAMTDDSSYVLAGDITLPAGYLPMQRNAFHLDGNGYSVTLPEISLNAARHDIALFASLNGESSVQNLTVKGSVLLDDTVNPVLGQEKMRIGGVAAYAEYTRFADIVSEVAINVKVVRNIIYCGGIVAEAGTGVSVTDCRNLGVVTGFASRDDLMNIAKSGGIIGQAIGMYGEVIKISNCIGEADVMAISGTDSYAGGIVGDGGPVEITDCKSSGGVRADGGMRSYAGGIIGFSRSNGIINGATSTANIKSNGYSLAYAGGLAGRIEDNKILNCGVRCTVSGVSTESMSGLSHVGGFIGEAMQNSASEVKIYNNFSISSVNSKTGASNVQSSAAGFVENAIGGTYYNCYSASTIDASVMLKTPGIKGSRSGGYISEAIYYDGDKCQPSLGETTDQKLTTAELKAFASVLSTNATKKNDSGEVKLYLKSFTAGSDATDGYPDFGSVFINNADWTHVAAGYVAGIEKAKAGTDYRMDSVAHIVEVYTAKGLGYIALVAKNDEALFNDYTLKINAELDMSAYRWAEFKFGGNIDGNGYMISGIHVGSKDNPADYAGGFISQYTFDFNQAKYVKNLGLRGEIYSTSAISGGLIGTNMCYGLSMTNVFCDFNIHTNSIVDTNSAIGGIVGASNYPLEISNSYAVGKIDASFAVGSYNVAACGGLVGKTDNILMTSVDSLHIVNSYANVSVNAENSGGSTNSVKIGYAVGYSLTGRVGAENSFYNQDRAITVGGEAKPGTADSSGEIVGFIKVGAAELKNTGSDGVAAKLNGYAAAAPDWYSFKVGTDVPRFDIYSFTVSTEIKDVDGTKTIQITADKSWVYTYRWYVMSQTGEWRLIEGASGAQYVPTEYGTRIYRAEISNAFESVVTEQFEVTIVDPAPIVVDPKGGIPAFVWIAIGIGVAAGIALTLFFLLYKKKFTVKYFVDGELMYEEKVKSGKPLAVPTELKDCMWFEDTEFQKKLAITVMPKGNLSLYTTVDYGEYHSQNEETAESLAKRKAEGKPRAKTASEPVIDDRLFREMMAKVPMTDADDGKQRYSDITFLQMMALVPAEEVSLDSVAKRRPEFTGETMRNESRCRRTDSSLANADKRQDAEVAPPSEAADYNRSEMQHGSMSNDSCALTDAVDGTEDNCEQVEPIAPQYEAVGEPYAAADAYAQTPPQYRESETDAYGETDTPYYDAPTHAETSAYDECAQYAESENTQYAETTDAQYVETQAPYGDQYAQSPEMTEQSQAPYGENAVQEQPYDVERAETAENYGGEQAQVYHNSDVNQPLPDTGAQYEDVYPQSSADAEQVQAQYEYDAQGQTYEAQNSYEDAQSFDNANAYGAPQDANQKPYLEQYGEKESPYRVEYDENIPQGNPYGEHMAGEPTAQYSAVDDRTPQNGGGEFLNTEQPQTEAPHYQDFGSEQQQAQDAQADHFGDFGGWGDSFDGFGFTDDDPFSPKK